MLRCCGATVRLRIRACDKALQGDGSESNSSASNQLQGHVLQVLNRDGPHCTVGLALTPPDSSFRSGATLWALLTRRSVSTTGLNVGQTVIASFEAAAVEGRSVAGFGGPIQAHIPLNNPAKLRLTSNFSPCPRTATNCLPRMSRLTPAMALVLTKVER